MKANAILAVALAGKFSEALDYVLPEQFDAATLSVGVRVVVPLGRSQRVGVLLAIKSRSEVDPRKLREVIAIVDRLPVVSDTLMALLVWMSEYYHHPIGDTIMAALPKAVRAGKVLKPVESGASDKVNFTQLHALTSDQQQAVERINQKQGFSTFLLEGVTGSGKTEVYMQVVHQRLQQGLQVLILVPEIGLTPQTIGRFAQRFSVPVVALHSHLTDRQRLHNWQAVQTTQPLVVIGTRLAVFAPVVNLGLIVVDEEHDLSFKQQSGLRYSARDVAIKRAHLQQVPVVLGSATPSFESYLNVKVNRYDYLKLPRRVGQAVMPTIEMIDLKRHTLQAGLSARVIERIRAHLDQGKQVLVFLNRRGYAPVLLCHHCGWTVECPNCDAYMVWHKSLNRLHCHHCDRHRMQPSVCEQCQQSELTPVGLGTQRLDERLAKLFPKYKIVRVDRDATRKKNSFDKILQDINHNEPMVLVGTQMLAKGHHFTNLSLVVMVDVDSGLFSVDFRAQERLAQLITQVAGRAGRGNHPGEVLLQTHHPEHPLLQCLLSQGYQQLADNVLAERSAMQLPPYSHMVLLHAQAKRGELADNFLQKIKDDVVTSLDRCVQIWGPVPAPMNKRQGYYRSQLLIKSSSRLQLQRSIGPIKQAIAAAKASRHVRWALDVDPLEMV